MRLSEFINENKDQIIREWEEFAKTLSPDGTLPTILRDHVSAIISSIVENMETFQDRSEEVEKSKGLGPIGLIDEVAAVHVNLRVQTGFDLVKIMAEYRALRSSTLRLWAKDDPEGFTRGQQKSSGSMKQSIKMLLRQYNIIKSVRFSTAIDS